MAKKNNNNDVDFKVVLGCLQEIAKETGAASTALSFEVQDGWEVTISIKKQ